MKVRVENVYSLGTINKGFALLLMMILCGRAGAVQNALVD